MYTEIRTHNGVPALFLDGEKASSHWAFCSPDCEGDFTKAGIRIFNISLPHFGLRHAWWTGPEQFDFSPILDELKSFIEAAPDALFVPRFHTGLAESDWFPDVFPDECNLAIRIDTGRPDLEYRHPRIGKPQHSMASKIWRELAARASVEFVRAVEDLCGDRIIGYHVGGGFSGEWFTWQIVNRESLDDYSAPMRKAFREYLRSKYSTDDELREAWSNPEVSIETAEIPSVARRANPTLGGFYSREFEQDIIDYQECYGHEAAQSCIHLCRAVKDVLSWRKVVGVFFGYLIVFNQTHVPQRSGHLGFDEILDSNAIDFISSPYHYEYRGWGQNHHPQTLPTSIRKHGKLYVDEIDTNPHSTVSPFPWITGLHAPTSIDDFCEILKRDYAWNQAFGSSFWWMDLRYEGWYSHDKVTNTLKTLVRAEHEMSDAELGSTAEIAVVLHLPSYHAAFPGPTHQEPYVTHLTQWELARTGAPYDLLLLDDFLSSSGQYKLAIFPMTANLTPSEAEQIMDRVRNENISVIWFHAPGYTSSSRDIQSIIGWEWSLGKRGFGSVIIKNTEHWLTHGVPEGLEYGVTSGIDERRKHSFRWFPDPKCTSESVIIKDGRSDFIGALSSGEGVGLAVREDGSSFSILSSAPAMTSRLLRNAARRAGVHMYAPFGDIVFAGKHFLGLTSGYTGEHRISLPRERDMVDLQTGKTLVENATEIELPLEYGHTALLKTTPVT